MRQIRFGGVEHQKREIHAEHYHRGEGYFHYFGNGREVMVVCKNRSKPWVEVYGPGDTAPSGAEFRYQDFFLENEVEKGN